MRFRSLENANPISSVFNFRIRLRQPEAQGAVFFLTLLEKTIPKPTKTSLEHEAVRQKRDIRTRFPTTT